MLKLINKEVDIKHFPDGTLLMKEDVEGLAAEQRSIAITWLYENNEELVALIFLTKHLHSKGITNIE